MGVVEPAAPRRPRASSSIRFNDPGQQLKLLDDSVHDKTPTMSTGVESLNLLLRRGGLLPGNFALLGGRTGTRKSTFMLNMALSIARSGVPVGIIGIDEPPWLYVVKLLSAFTGRPQEEIEEMWDEVEGQDLREEWKKFARRRVHLFTGRRPGPDHLSAALDLASLGDEGAPRVLFIDYLGAMTRDGKYGYGEQGRITLLAEELQSWSSETGVAVVALHQLSRTDEFGGSNNRNAGHLPVTRSQMKFAGEEQADLVLGTYRPAMDPIGGMDYATAKTVLGKDFDEDEYYERRARVAKHKDSTFVQLLKNRPGTHEELKGIEMVSPNDSLVMVEKEAE